MNCEALLRQGVKVVRRQSESGNEGVEFGQYLYEIYNHDVELRVSKAGVSTHL